MARLTNRGHTGPNASGSQNSPFSRALIIPILAIVFATIITPMLNYSHTRLGDVDANRIENKIFWPLLAISALCVFFSGWRNIANKSIPLHLLLLGVLLAYCGMTVAWSVRPELALVRISLQVMICIAVVLPFLVAKDCPDIFYAAFLSFAAAAAVNVYYIQINNPVVVAALQGFPGYYESKNTLGQFMGLGFILALAALVRQGGSGRTLAILASPVIVWCLYYSNSKTAFGLAFLSPVLALGVVLAGRITKLSPAVLIAAAAFLFYASTKALGITMGRLSYALYKDATFTGRTTIWDFLNEAIAMKWLQGWGYGSVWLTGGAGPSSHAPGWVRMMPSGHNGYLDVTAEAGNIGFALLLAFVFATLHAIRPLVQSDPKRAWVMLSLAFYALIYNFLESSWLRSYEIIWLMFLVIAADAARASVTAKNEAEAAPAASSEGGDRSRRPPFGRPLRAAAFDRPTTSRVALRPRPGAYRSPRSDARRGGR